MIWLFCVFLVKFINSFRALLISQGTFRINPCRACKILQSSWRGTSGLHWQIEFWSIKQFIPRSYWCTLNHTLSGCLDLFDILGWVRWWIYIWEVLTRTWFSWLLWRRRCDTFVMWYWEIVDGSWWALQCCFVKTWTKSSHLIIV